MSDTSTPKLPNLERPNPFVVKHHYAVYTRRDKFHSRYASLLCAARSVADGDRHEGLGPGAYAVNERTGDLITHYDCAELVRNPKGRHAGR